MPSTETQTRPRWLAIVITPIALFWFFTRDPVSQARWDRIQPGATKQEVISLLGRPDRTYGNQFQYSNFLNPGWVSFDFDNDGRLLSKNDESVNGSLR